jgi:rsbT antagonist protein RsbS
VKGKDNNVVREAVMVQKIPILKIGEFLIASVQIELQDASAVQFKDDILEAISEHRARGVVVDLTAVEVVDSFLGRIIGDVAAMARLMGARVVVTGLQPAVAITLVELGLELRGVVTALNLEKGLEKLHQLVQSEG